MPLFARDIEFGLDIPANADVFVSLTVVMDGVEAEAQASAIAIPPRARSSILGLSRPDPNILSRVARKAFPG